MPLETTGAPLANLSSRVDLTIPGFEKVAKEECVRQLAPRVLSPGEWFEKFKRRLSEGKGYTPVYRMSDGEFIFVCGWRPYSWRQLGRYPALVLRSWAKSLLRRRTDQFSSGSKGYGFEAYSQEEWQKAKSDYAVRVQRIAADGILAVNFVYHLHFPQQYAGPMCNWMEENSIRLTEANYYPFYFIYAHFLGVGALTAYRGRRILVITSDEDGTKEVGIRKTLIRLGALSVAFIPISRSKAMFDRIDISGVGKVDLVLIGAGVGAVNILEQVRPLDAVSVDVGYVLDCLWKPRDFVGRRAFTSPDEGSPLLSLECDAPEDHA